MTGRNDDKNEGEGSRTADEKYRAGVAETIRTKDIEKLAEEARQAYESDTGELMEAEKIGLAKAFESPHVDPRILDVAQIRDEVRVRMHLAKAEAKEAFEKLETRFLNLVGKANAMKDASADTVSDVAAASSLVVEELKRGYERLRYELSR